MLTLSRKEVRLYRSLCRRADFGGDRGRPLFTRFVSGRDALRLQFRAGAVELEWTLPSRAGTADFAVPHSVLALCEGTDDSPVVFRQDDDEVVVDWTDGAVPQQRRFRAEDHQAPGPLPEAPPLTAMAPPVFAALAEAASCAGEEEIRFATRHLQLRGGPGEVAATDSHHLYLRGGLPWPWQDNVLVPASRAFGAKELGTGPVGVGRTAEQVVLRSGAWTLWLRLEKVKRFPPVDEVMPKLALSRTQLRLDPVDATFLKENLGRLPSPEPLVKRVTLHLNGQALVRARSEGGATTELSLRHSQPQRAELLLNTDPAFLERALRLGFTDLRFWQADRPVLALDGDRRYLWAGQPAAGAFPPVADARRIESPRAAVKKAAERFAAPIAPPRPAAVPATRTPAAPPVPSMPAASVAEKPALNLVQEAEELRALLRSAGGRANVLLAEIKRQRRRNRAVRSAFALLPQLQEAA